MDLKELADRLNGDNPAGWAWVPQDADPDENDRRDIDATAFDPQTSTYTVEIHDEDGEGICLNLTIFDLQDLHDTIGVALTAARLAGHMTLNS